MEKKSLIISIFFFINIPNGAFSEDTSGDDGLNLKLVEVAKTAAKHMELVGEPHIGRLEKRGVSTVDIQLDRARCYAFIVVGDAGVTDLNLTLSAHGKEVAGDRISGKQPLVKWCAPGRVKVEVKLAMYDGSGAFALGVFGEHLEAVPSVERVGGNGNDFVANRIRQLHGQFGKGRAAITSVFKGNLSTGNDKVFKVRLKAEHCYTIIAAGNPSVRNLDIVLVSPSGSEIAKDKSRNNFPTVDTSPCPRTAGQYKIRVNMFEGFGQFGLQVFSD